MTLRAAAVFTVLLAGFLLVEALVPLQTAVQTGADEGFELAKATMYLRGHLPYKDFWNDQPFLHTFLVSGILERLSASILGPRLLTRAFAAVLLASLFWLSLRLNGLLVAAIAGALLLASPGFVELSSSCMLEIPALATAVAAVCLMLIWRQGRWWLGGLLAGALFGMAMQIKYIAAVYLPFVVLIAWVRAWNTSAGDAGQRGRRNPGLARLRGEPPAVAARGPLASALECQQSAARLVWRPVMSFGLGSIASFLLINTAIGGAPLLLQFRQSWVSHFAAAQSFEYGSPADHPFDWSILFKNWDTTLPAVVGVAVLWRQRRRQAAARIPLAWLALTLAVFGLHRPWWSYYYLHNAVPLCWCASVGIVSAAGFVRRWRYRLPAVALAVYALAATVWMGGRVYLQVRDIRRSPQTYSSLVLKEIARLKPFTKFIYASDPIYSFHAGIPLPPQVGIVPLKRLWSGDVTSDRLAVEMQQIKPGIILLQNDTQEVTFQQLLESDYRLVYEDAEHRLYARRDVARVAGY